MIARSSKIHHPQGSTLETPLLVPSFSSKGFGFSKSGESNLNKIFDVASQYLTDTMLVSAYDLYAEHFKQIENSITELIFVDSGGYEISDQHDLSSVYHHHIAPKEWSTAKLKQVYSTWKEYIPAVFVSYDHPELRFSLSEQIEAATDLLGKYPNQLHTILLKPETEHQNFIQTKNVIANIEKLRAFNIVGFTEKELGSSILKRMLSISEVRLAMDDQQINIPIHIYGSLDPVTSVLYFLAGAEIFDGLTWLRYGYSRGAACYWNNFGAKSVGISWGDDFIRGKIMQENLSYLIDLTHQMRKFLLDNDFSRFSFNGEFLQESYDLLKTKNKRI